MKKLSCLVLLALAAATSWSQDEPVEHPRGFILEVGAGGLPYLTYGSVADSQLSSYASVTGADRIQVYLHLDLGWAVSQTTYVVVGIDGFGDGFFVGDSSQDQLNSYLYAIGIRYFPFVTGLMIGADAGASRLVVTSNASAVGSTAWSWGLGTTVAWDFGGNPTGWAIQLGVRALYLSVSDPVITRMFGVTPYISLEVK